jgi:1-pyrroline-5-carboxylate dehydrogenase
MSSGREFVRSFHLMSNAIFHVPAPINEPVKSYGPGSPEKAALKKELARQKAETVDIPLVIGGEHRYTKAHETVTCPHEHKRVLARSPSATEGDIDAAIAAANKARRDWQAMPWESRAAIFLKAAELLATKYRATMNAATMLGQSKTAFQAEIDAACELIDFWRFNAHFMREIYQEQPQSAPGMWNRSVARGLEGFVYAVTPFNFTSIALNLPTAPALMGCTVLWKPAHTSMLSSWVGLQILEEAGLPPGVINLVAGDPRMVSSRVLPHRDLAGLHFTGSTGTFNTLWKAIAQNVDSYRTYPRLVGETGGKDFVFAHPSADVDALVTALIRGAFEYQGQKCSAASRAYVPKSLWKDVKERLVAQTSELKLGDPEDFRNFMGAVIDQRSFEKIKGYIDAAKRDGSAAQILAGGECDDKTGWFVRPTVIEAKDPTFRTMCEEIFGPVLTVHVYDDGKLDEALALCEKTSPYALTGAIFARDRAALDRMTTMLEHAAGNFYINDKPTGAVVGQQPFGGARNSGTNDKAGSKLNLLRWVSARTIKETFVPPTSYRYPFLDEA